MVVKNRIGGKKCPKCNTVLTPTIITLKNSRCVEYKCDRCGYKESDYKPIDIDLRYRPTFNTLPIIDI